MRKLTKIAVVLTLLVWGSACTKAYTSKNQTSSGSSLSDGAALLGKVSISVKDSGGAVVYDDSGMGSLVLRAGQSYHLVLSVAQDQPGTTYVLQQVQTNVISGGSNVFINLAVGDNAFTIPNDGQGAFAWKLVASGPNMTPMSKSYLAEVQCMNPSFSEGSLNASAISVSAGSDHNLYNLSASGVTANADGTGPYFCAWDPTGTGIQDTDFKPCGDVASNIYINYVQDRNIGLLVKDSCFKVHTIAKLVNLLSTTPAMGVGIVFISGVNSGATGTAATNTVIGDPRVENVNYLATNSGGNNVVQPDYAHGTFTIRSEQSYGLLSSKAFGINITVSNIADTLDLATGGGSVDVTNAKLHSLTYTTDQAGDQKPVVALSDMNCTLSNQHAKTLFSVGQPCSTGETGTNHMFVVEVWGHYSCSLTNASGNTLIEGDFDGLKNLADSCVGGGGQGGGGIVPIGL